MHRFILIIQLFLIAFGVFGQVQSKSYQKMLDKLLDHSVKEISVTEAASLVDSIVYFDAREAKEYEVSHLQNAKHIGYKNFSLDSVKLVPKNQTIIVYCSVGYRSEKVTKQLISAGFTDVQNLVGGIFEWKNENQPLYDSTGRTDRVHGYDRIWGVWLKKGKKVY